GRLGADVPGARRGDADLVARLAAGAAIEGAREAVRPAARDGVHAGADEVALAHVVRRDADLHLLDGFEGDRRDAGAVARLAAEAERVVEVGAVDRDVVGAVVLADEGAAARV